MSHQCQLQLDQASDAMTESFFDYYQNMVNYFHQTPNDNLTYRAFRERTNRAKSPLISEQEAIFYTVAYGWQHYQSIQHLLSETIIIDDAPSHIRVIDYGCGQGIATLAFMDYLAEHGVASQNSLEVHLIEPSAISLSIAKRLINRLATLYGMRVSIHCQQHTLDNALLPLNNECDETFHFMSNVIDIQAVQDSLPSLAAQIMSCAGRNFLLATCPSYKNAQIGFDILHKEMSFADSYCDEQWIMTHEMYHILYSKWCQRTSKTRVLMKSWHNS